MKSIKEIKLIFLCIDCNFFNLQDAFCVLENRHKIYLNEDEKIYFYKLHIEAKNLANSLDMDVSCNIFKKLYFEQFKN